MRVGTHQSEKNGNAESQAPSNADGWGLLKTQMGWRVNPHPHAAGMALPALYGALITALIRHFMANQAGRIPQRGWERLLPPPP